MKKLILLLSVAALSAQMGVFAGVKAWEGELTLPSYKLDAPESTPIFDCDWSYQRARRSVYPYPLNDNMTRTREIKSYKALYLENEYVKICILPEIGGRLFYATDKTNNYEIFYRQDVIKPANVGMTGAWISGGVEWNVFHHHRATSHTPVDYRIESNKDGSKTVWLGETELRHRMSWAIGVTLHPKKSYMEISGRLINSTHNANSMLYWSNVSTHVDKNYQIIFPQNTEFGVFHCKNSFCHWPITKETFTEEEEYENNIKADWWAAHPKSNSIFVHDLKDDFIAGYDHGKRAGTMLVGNHHIIKGGKFWSWGPNSGWPTKILTDTAGHYIELMSGAYSDNQPDYNWTYPYETKTFSQYWYGIRDIGGVKKGSKLAAINLELLGSNKVLLGANATEELEDAKLVLTLKGKEVFSETINISPEKPFVKKIDVAGDYKETDFTLTLKNEDGKTLLSYTAVEKGPNKPLPPIVDRPLLPSQIKNTEECYLVGLRNLQFHNPFVNPVDYFEEVLRRDAGDTRANTQMGVYWRLRGDNAKAEKYLRTAIARQTKDYTRPKDCEATYNLGLILKDEGKTEEAIEMLYRAVWSYAYNSAANFQLAQIYSQRGEYDLALERLNEAITYNGNNLPALNLKTTILRTLDREDEAEECAKRVLKVSPVNAYAMCEMQMLEGGNDFNELMRDNVESYIELALKYMHNGFNKKAIELLRYIDKKQAYPTVKMWLGNFAEKSGNDVTAERFYKAALDMPVEYCNPFRLETAKILQNLTVKYPNNAKAWYYLGNIYYDKQPEKAIDAWKKCVAIDASYTMAWRNLGWAYWKYKKDLDKASEYYKKAIALDSSIAMFFEEIDQVLEAKGADVAERYALLKNNHDTCTKRYYPLAMEVVTGIFQGDFDYVLGLLKNCYFPTREGVANFHDVYVDALLMAGKQKFSEGKTAEAIELYKKAFEFPENHQVFLYDTRRPRDAQIYYMIAQAYEAAGDKVNADKNYNLAANVKTKRTDYRYWQGVALQKIGKAAEAKKIFETLREVGKNGVVETFVNFYGAEGTTGSTPATINTKAYYTKGLGELGLGNKQAALADFKKSLSLKRDNLWTREMLKDLQAK